jgi:acyl phosphate:glycerol-3-phosphate acyltransferase
MPWLDQLQSIPWIEAGSIALGAYILGCFSTGYYLVRRLAGQDIRQLGSGSVGARNVGRQLGWKGFVLTLAGDFGKGAFAVWAAGHFTREPLLLGIAMLAVVTGHIWPAQLRFQGGKGIATSLGALSLLDVRLVLALVTVFVIAFLVLRKSVLPGLIAYAFLPWISAFLRRDSVGADENLAPVLLTFGLAVLILVAHRRNLVQEITNLFDRHLHPKQNPPKL